MDKELHPMLADMGLTTPYNHPADGTHHSEVDRDTFYGIPPDGPPYKWPGVIPPPDYKPKD